MKTLNPIQILDLQDLAKIEAGKIDKRLANALDNTAKGILSADLKRMESAIAILDEMFNVALEQENAENDDGVSDAEYFAQYDYECNPD